FQGTLRVQSRLFRPILMLSDSVHYALEKLLAAEQSPRARVRHLWLGGLPRQGRHAVAGALKDTGLELTAHDVDQAVGQPGPVSALLLQALAAQMVEHGQGAQLIASPRGEGVMLNLNGTQLTPIADAEASDLRMFNVSTSIGIICSFGLMVLILVAVGASPGWFWGCVALFVILMFPIQIGGSFLRRREVEDDFYRQLQRTGAWT